MFPCKQGIGGERAWFPVYRELVLEKLKAYRLKHYKALTSFSCVSIPNTMISPNFAVLPSRNSIGLS